MIILQKIFTSIPRFYRWKLYRQGFLKETLNEENIHFPVMLFEIRSYLLKELIQCFQTQVDQDY